MGFVVAQRGGCTPIIKPRVPFADIMATESRLNTLYGLVCTLYVQ